MIDDIPHWKIVEGMLFHFDKRRPILFTVLKIVGLGRLAKFKPMIAVLAKSRRRMGTHLDALKETFFRVTAGPIVLGAARLREAKRSNRELRIASRAYDEARV